MKLTDICVSLELAKELKENGFPDKTLFVWTQDVTGYSIVMRSTGSLDWGNVVCLAPTVAELGEALPECISTERVLKKWSVNSEYDFSVISVTEVNARAKMWLYLKKIRITR